MATPVKRGLGDSVFLVKTLEKILNDKETKRSQHQRLRRACEDALKDIKEEQKKLKGQAESQSPSGNINADKYFLPLELAFRSNIPRVVNVSLDCVQKLVAYGLLRGESVDPDNPDKHLIDRIIDTICGCFVGVQTDEGVQLQIIKALLTILTSNNVEVHGGTVLQAVRCCYNIFLASRSPINQTTAKASLTQIISTLFQNLENEESLQVMARERMAMSYPTPPPSHSDNQSDTSSQSHDRIPDLVEQEDRRLSIRKQDPELAAIASKLVEQVLAKVVAEECMRIPSSYVEDKETEREKDELSSEFTVSIASTTASAFDDTESLHSTLSEVRDPSPHPQTPALIKGNLQFRHILQKDCFLVFRTLCKLSMKNVTDIHDPRSHERRSKVISLELLLSILENSGPVFRTDEVFIGAIKHHLCVALSKNGVSSVPEVFELSLSIFLALFSSFKAHLKMQIEVFFKEIFLNILETSTSSFQLKWLVLQALMRVCNDAQSIVDIFLNYDCDLSLANVYGRLVNDLSRIGQGRQAVELGATPLQERKIRVKGLECLVSILKCLVEWSRELYIDPSTTGLNAVSPITGGGSGVGPTQHSLNHTSEKKVKHNKVKQAHSIAEAEGTSVSEGTMATDSPEQFETQKLMKETMEKGIKLFVDKPKKGIAFLQDKGILGNKPEDIAKLFYTDERFDKTAIGDYMGEGDEFNKYVMYAYIDCFDFSKIDFVPALRLLLSSFRLPGEAQKIDRIMEKFASRYCETNPSLGIFASADTAYVLAYSIIMLTTDLHSSQVKRKMTKEDYIRMNRGINDSKDLPREYLEAIYDEIASSEIKLKTSVESRQSLARQSMVGVSEKQRRQAYNQEMSVMAETAQALMEHISDKQAQFTSATHVEHVKSMFKVAWTPVLAALSVALRDTDDPEVVSLCLDGFRCAIRVACIFGLTLERDAYIKSLAKFTMLMTSTGITEMKVKNIEVIKTLCTVAYTDGNYLQSSWIDVLQCISQLELAQLIGSGVKTRYLTSGPPTTTTKGGSTSGSTRGSSIDNILMGTDTKKIASILESVEGTSNQRVVVAVDRIFTGTTRLDGAAIVDFVEALCAVSNEELSSPAHARMFSLQKIIELSYYNMERIRLEMSRIWEVIGAHFNTVGCLPNEEVSFFVVDSLRQLSMKFVEKKELANFRFQKDFLRPFEYIMKRNESVTIRDMVVRCVAQIIQAKAQNIVSGWKNIFSVFLLAAADHDQTIVELSFQTTSSIFENHFEATIDSFQDAIKCLAEFACNASYPDTSMEAIRIIRICAKHVAERPELFHVAEEGVVVDSDRIWVKAWFPIMFELSTIISRCKLDVRTRGLTVMFEIMKTYGQLYHQHWWTDLFNVVFRLFGNMKFPDSPLEKAEWMTTTCNHALYALMDVFTQFFDRLCSILLGDILSQLLWCIQQDNEQLARSGTNCLENLVISVGEQFTGDIWDKICQCVLDIYKVSIPEELNSWRPTEDHPSHSNLSIASSHSSLVSDTVVIRQSPSPQDPHSAPPSVIPPAIEATPLTQDIPHPVEVITGTDTPDNTPFQLPLSETITEPLPAPPDIHISRPSVDLADTNKLNQLQEQVHPVSQEPSVVHSQISADVTQEDIQRKTKSATPPATMTQTVDMTEKSKPVSRHKASSVSSSRDDNKRRSLIRPRKDKEEKSRSKSKKKDKKKGQSKEKAPSAEETPSELSYNHPDTDMTLAKSRTQRLSVFSPEHSLFNSLSIKCVVQLELIQAVDNIIFHPTITRQDDQNILNAAGVMSIHYPLPLPPYSDRGMFQYLSTPQLFVLLDCLEQSHMFARSFNSNHNQRIVLMKAGFLGRSKPNLLLQETSSLLTALRILYRMLEDKSRENEYSNIETRLLELVTSSLTYFLTLTLDTHRSSWTPVLLLIFTRMLQITVDEFKRHMAVCYPHLCELVSLELKYEVRCLLRRVLTRVGSEFNICSFSEITY